MYMLKDKHVFTFDYENDGGVGDYNSDNSDDEDDNNDDVEQIFDDDNKQQIINRMMMAIMVLFVGSGGYWCNTFIGVTSWCIPGCIWWQHHQKIPNNMKSLI